MCHLPSSYDFVEDVDKVLSLVIAEGGSEMLDEMLAMGSKPLGSVCFASGECAASEARLELAKEIETDGVVSFKPWNEVT